MNKKVKQLRTKENTVLGVHTTRSFDPTRMPGLELELAPVGVLVRYHQTEYLIPFGAIEVIVLDTPVPLVPEVASGDGEKQEVATESGASTMPGSAAATDTPSPKAKRSGGKKGPAKAAA